MILLYIYTNPALRWCLACRLKTSHLSYLRLGRCIQVVFRSISINFILQVVNFRNSALCVVISLFVLNILRVSCCWAIRWGAFPRQKNDVAWTSFGRRSDVVFSTIYHVPYLISHFTFRFANDSTVQQTIIKIDPSAACSAAHATGISRAWLDTSEWVLPLVFLRFHENCPG